MLRISTFILLLIVLFSCTSSSNETESDEVDPVAISLNNSAVNKLQNYTLGLDENSEMLKMALDEIDEAISLEPKVDIYYSNKANILLALNKDDEAIKELKKIISFKPDFAEILQEIGFIYEKNENNTEALNWYHKAIKAYQERISEERFVINSKMGIAHLLFFTQSEQAALDEYYRLKNKYPDSDEVQFAEPFFINFDKQEFFEDFNL